MTAIITATAVLAALALVALWSHRRARLGDGCDCTELCEMGPTCPGGMLAGLEGSGCWRTDETIGGFTELCAALDELDDNRRAEVALRVRDRLGPAGDDEGTFAAVLAEVESLVVMG